ncbi:MAG: 3-methyl-2-oxobutanoate hydroxymethyltransferase [bacterium]
MSSVNKLLTKYNKGQAKLSMLTVYDYSMAKAMDGCVDIFLVGDSLGMVIYGQKNTHKVTMSQMIAHTRAVSLATSQSIVVADMPKGSYEHNQKALVNANKLIKSGAEFVKIENYPDIADMLTKMGIKVFGHVGLTPQTITDFKLQGKTLESASKIKQTALELEKAGCSAVVLECIPQQLAKEITETLKIPTIGIGSGKFCDGQVLVSYDLLGLYNDFKPKFVKQYANLSQQLQAASKEFDSEVKKGLFPV